ncbi:choice-of-anchor J domain-containing protein [Flavobacterium paronense]|uniref:Choice-of-anchor J domain-containing protein n=1 Tax=Flavobacterium paronense TaxID=1392775 RepID=A0ABV5GHA8_9FLAO|nr:choice-of-anchor J domain-containing protein [Flavobacterium paronense]MDN3676387.1 choice-of-anchor J domain-containing protein [Flavobacterium paronense]
MQKNYLSFKTTLSKTKNGIFQKKTDYYWACTKIILPHFYLLLLLFVSNLGYSQLALESFDSGIPGTWAVNSNLATAPANNWIATPNGGYLGSGGALVNPSLNNTQGITAEYYLISPQFLTPSNGEIRFFTKQGSFLNRGATYQIRISTANQPDISSFNVVLQSWTEAQLNASATVYEEKVVPIPSIPAGIPVYIAFVAVTNQTGTAATIGDTWFVDRARVISSCSPVTGITSVSSTNSVVINWAHPTATNFGIEVVAAGAGHGPTGTPVTGTTYTANGLTPNTTYDVYIITNCDGTTSSTWAGPFSITTTLVGMTCANPIVIPTTVPITPFVYSNNLSVFNDTMTYTEYSSLGNSCLPPGTTQNYLSGDHAFFNYTPTTDGLINITQAINVSGGAGNCYNSLTGVFIYDSCAGVGTSAACLGATTTDSDTPSTIFNVFVQAGHSYTIVVSSPFQHDTPGAGICFTLTVSGSSCPAPSGITYQHLTQNGAEFSWNNIGNFVSEWQYVAVPANLGAPTGSETLTTTLTNLNNLVTGLLPNTAYNFYVRSVCSSTPGEWSAPLAFTTQCTVFTLPYYTGFTHGGECWTALNLNNDASSFNFGPNWESEPCARLRTGEAANFTNDILVSPKLQFDGTQKRLRFKYQVYGNWGPASNPTPGPGSFEIKLSTTGVGEQDFTTTVLPLASYTTGYDFIEKIVVLPAGIIGDVNIAWILPNGATQTGIQFYIDDVYVEDLPACSEPSYPVVTAGSITNTSLELSWISGFNNTQWQIVAQPQGTGTPTTSGILVSTNPYTLTGLMPSTRYEIYIRAYCSATEQSTWAGPINVNTVCDPQPTPYYESLDDADPNTKKFCWSKNNQNGDTTEWFINTNDATISQAPSFFTPFGGFDDWLISGPVNAVGNKRLRFNYRVSIGIFAPSPRGNLEILLSTTPDFSTYTTLIPSHDFTNTAFQEDSVLFTGAGTVYVAFRVPPTMTDPSNSGIIMINDITIDDAPACPDPSHLGLTSITSTSADLNWIVGNTETQWQIVVQPAGSGIPAGSGTIVNTTPTYNATGLTPDTAYEYYVRAVCTSENSNWVGPFTFRTTCNPISTPFLETFDTTSTTETCWKIINGNAIAYDWDLNESVNPIFGNQMASIFSGSNGDNDDWLITPTLSAHAGQRLRFYYKVYDSEFHEDLKIKLSTNGTTVNQFSTLLYQNSLTTTTNAIGTVEGSNTITVASAEDIRVGDVLYMPGFPFPYQTRVTNITGTVITLSNAATLTLTGEQSVELTHEVINNEEVKEMVINLTSVTSATNINIGFYIPRFLPNPWGYRSQFLFVDNVIVEDIPLCPSVINVTTNNIVDTTADINWETTGSETSWEISVQPFGTPAPIGATLPAYLHTTTAHPYTVTGLTPATQYQYYVRAICSSTSQSEWIGPFEFTTRCDFANVCQYTISVTNGNTGQVTNNVSVKQNGVEVQALEFPGFGQPTTIDYTIFLCSGVEFNLYWNGLGSGVQYSEAQITIKDESNTVIWTSPLGLGTVNTNIYTGFASCGTITCPQPTNLAVSNQGLLTWTPGATETQWEVFIQPLGNGTLPQSGHIVNTASYTPITTDFVDATAGTYEYFVRAICGTSNNSYWSGPKVFVRNDEPTTSVRLQVNTAEVCQSSGIDASFIGATASSVPTSCPGINGGDIWYDFIATSKIHYIELSDFTPGSYYDSSFEGPWPKIIMSLYEVQTDGSLVEKGCSENNSMTTMYSSELVVGYSYKIRLKLNSTIPSDKKFHICITTPNDLCEVNAFNYSFEKLPMQDVGGISTILDALVIPGWRVNTDWGTMFFLDSSNLVGGDPYSGGQYVQLVQDGEEVWNPSDPNIKGLYKDFDTSEITKMDYSFASATRTTTGTTLKLFAGPPSGPFTVVAQHTANSTTWQLVEGTYTIPTGQTNTRFIFRVEGNAIGHLLDAANFKANVEINIATPNTTLDCATTSMNFDANGVGQWVAEAGNPATTTIANPNSGATNVSGFTAPGSYIFHWNTRYCQKSITITKQGTTAVATVTSPVVYCIGATATSLTATAPSGNSLMWYTGGTGTTIAPIPATATAGNTSYYVSVVDGNGCEGPRTEIAVTVNALPTATISGTTTVCLNAPCTTITFTGANGVAPYTFIYTDNNGVNQTITSTGNSATICVPTLSDGVFTYNLVSVSSSDLVACSQTQTGSAIVTVEELPTVAISGTSTICSGQTATISFIGTPDASVIYTVNSGSNQTIVLDGAGLASITTSPLTSSTTYSLVSVTSAGTASCSQIITGSAIVTVTPLVTPNVTFSYLQTCRNAGVNPLPVLTTNFAIGGIFSSSTVTVNPTTGAVDLSLASVGSHQITYTLLSNTSTCTTGGTFTATLVIVTNITPVTGFSYAATYCANAANDFPITLTGFTSGGVFNAGAGLIINPTTGEINIAQSNAGNYTITYTIATDASACNAGGSSNFNITITPDFTFAIEDFCQNSNLTLHLINTNFNEETVSYTWTQGSNIVGTNATLNVNAYLTQNPSLSLPLTFGVSVSLNGCTTQQNFTLDDNPCLIIPRGISPNNDQVNDDFDLTGYGVNEILIFNRYGTKVYSFSGNYTNQWKGQTDGGSELPDGTYFYSIHTTDKAVKTGWVYINRQY